MPTKKKAPKFKRCRRRHVMTPENTSVQKRYYTPRLPAGVTPNRTVKTVSVCRKCIAARVEAIKAGNPLPDLRLGSR